MTYLGEYALLIEDEKVAFPWEDDVFCHRIWVKTEVVDGNSRGIDTRIMKSEDFDTYISELTAQVDECNILEKGDFVLDSGGMWVVPESIQRYLKSKEIVVIGAYHQILVLSMEDYADLMSVTSQSGIMSALAGIGGKDEESGSEVMAALEEME